MQSVYTQYLGKRLPDRFTATYPERRSDIYVDSFLVWYIFSKSVSLWGNTICLTQFVHNPI